MNALQLMNFINGPGVNRQFTDASRRVTSRRVRVLYVQASENIRANLGSSNLPKSPQ